jgi:hypothetical protein
MSRMAKKAYLVISRALVEESTGQIAYLVWVLTWGTLVRVMPSIVAAIA